ncbi:mitochondrial genome maintenance MGM101-domain-containing protein [Immersiella caudata]|uniref:Mitochondrial genome maintenance protein MGM101 n=1 Tax=Immersiella caudata TaxID=314043 RepID=A0AA39WJE3_9PEZI|nr:mitochondrial genome maintenance MGM101-domain-containing protein [Immersiella caudata]
MRSRALQILRPLRSCPSLRPSSQIRPASSTAPKSTTQWKPKPRTATTTAAPSSKPLPVTDTSTNPVDPQAAISSGPNVTEIDPSLSAAIPTPPSFTSALSSGAPNPGNTDKINWASSFHGLSTMPFPPETAAVLMKPLDPRDVEIKPDGIIYLPEIKYRRILNQAFGPGGWGLAPRGELVIAEKLVTREYALVVHGRFVSEARGECGYFSEETIPTAGEGCKSNALMRCCKDLGIASELWDPRYIREFKKTHAHEVWVEHVVNKKRRQVWKLKDADVAYPYKEVKSTAKA